MKLGGMQKLTLLDYPGRVACTVFTAGCNFRCPFCHNAALLADPQQEHSLTEKALFTFLRRRRGILDGVCVTGGEPTLHRDLPTFLAAIRALGFAVKLDTNGSHPDVLRRVIDAGLVDYVAMDLKNAPSRYAETTGCEVSLDAIAESASLLRTGTLPYEFRTTVVAELHDEAAFHGIGQAFGSDSPYYLQCFVDSPSLLQPGLHACSQDEMRRYLQIAKQYFPRAALRGMT